MPDFLIHLAERPTPAGFFLLQFEALGIELGFMRQPGLLKFDPADLKLVFLPGEASIRRWFRTCQLLGPPLLAQRRLERESWISLTRVKQLLRSGDVWLMGSYLRQR